MDFKITVKNALAEVIESKVFIEFSEAISYITTQMSQWNNFDSDKPITFYVEKVNSDTPTLGVSVDDLLDVADLFGRQ